jgi:hypothetical protein
MGINGLSSPSFFQGGPIIPSKIIGIQPFKER